MVVIFNATMVIIAVEFHYECLHILSRLLPHIPIRPRYKIVVGIGGALIAHAIEIWMFAAAYYLAAHQFSWGTLAGGEVTRLMDCAYYSFTVFTTLGFGDITPQGDLRYLTGLEALTGLVLITWTASFLYIEMQKYWDSEQT
ncbi:MAG: potassium channel family protein [Parahaliea sp.]